MWLTLAVLMGVSGCSTIKLAYNNSDDLIYWWLDSYADLQGEQKPFTRNALADLQRWHRQQQLPEYVALLKRMQAMAPNDITPAQVCAVTEDMKTSFVTLLRYVEPVNTQLASQLKPDQLRSIRQRFDKTNQEWRADWLDPSREDQLRYRNKLALSRIEDFYGHLDTPQREAIRLWIASSMFDPAKSYAERQRRQVDTLQTLQRITQEGIGSTGAQTKSQALLRGLTERTLNSPNEGYRAYSDALRLENCEGFAKLHNLTTTEQRQHLLASLQGYEQDFKALMTQK